MNLATLKIRAISILADSIWFISFFAIWYLLITLWNTAWAILLIPLFTFMLAGMAEVIHQATHGNLFGRLRPLNTFLGSFAALLMFGIDFRSYRRFHFKHHQTVNTPADTERLFYGLPAYVEQVKTWPQLSLKQKIIFVPKIIDLLGKAISATLYTPSPLVNIFRFGVPIAIALIGFAQGSRYSILPQVFVAWYLPFFLFLLIDIFITQSEHYGSAEIHNKNIVKAADQYKISWNLKLPKPVEFMVMGRNLHAEHHENPGLHWSETHDKKTGRTLMVSDYLKLWWENGPRVMG